MTSGPARSDAFEDKVFLFLVLGVSLAFVWILRPYAGAILWGTVLAIVFAPLNRHLRDRLPQRRGVAAAVTLVIIVVLVLFPVALIVASLIDEGTAVYHRIQSGELDVAAWFRQLYAALPGWAVDLLNRFGLTNLETVQTRLSGFLTGGVQLIATQALSIGQNTLQFVVALFVMLYLLFFLLRDGDVLSRRIRDAIPMPPERQRNLAGRFTTVIRATIKGNLVVALVQGALGWLIFLILGVGAPVLLGVLIALLSLLPAVGAPVVWVPVAIYLFATGHTWQAYYAGGVRRAGDRLGGQHPAADPGGEGHQAAGLRGAHLHAGRPRRVRGQRLRDRAGDRGAVRGGVGDLRGVARRLTGDRLSS